MITKDEAFEQNMVKEGIEKFPDGTEKDVPNGVRATMKMIRSMWENEGKAVSAIEEIAGSALLRVFTHFHFMFGKKRSQQIHRIPKLENGTTELKLKDLIALASYTGIPAGLLLLFTHAVSEESRSGQKGLIEIQAGIRGIIKSLQVVDAEIEDRKHESYGVFHYGKRGDEELLLARYDTFAKMVEAYLRETNGT
jgi:hypothetical protein